MEENKREDQIVETKEEDTTSTSTGKGECIFSLVFIGVFIAIIIGIFSSGCVQCTYCGSDNNRLIIYASGRENGVEYQSCVGPAGILGCGLNSKCWPTECMHIKFATSSNQELSGCVTYYNTAGCIANSDVKSVGDYTLEATCLGISCAGEKYIEEVAETKRATSQETCLGCVCGNEVSVNVEGYNELMPRQFKKGCWGVETEELGGE